MIPDIFFLVMNHSKILLFSRQLFGSNSMMAQPTCMLTSSERGFSVYTRRVSEVISYYLGTMSEFILGHLPGGQPHEPKVITPVLIVPLYNLFLPSVVEPHSQATN